MGVNVDESVSWEEHIDNVCTKLPKAMDHSPFKLNLHFCKKNQNLLPKLESAC